MIRKANSREPENRTHFKGQLKEKSMTAVKDSDKNSF